MRRSRMSFAAWVAALAVVAAACGSGGSRSSVTGSASGGGKGSITVGSANFVESEILADMYADVLMQSGYSVKKKLSLGSREVYLKALGAGEVDLMPEYVGTLTQVLNAEINGKDANVTMPLASGDLAETLANAKKLLQKKNLVVVGQPSSAADQNAYAVTQKTAQKYALETLSDLTKANGQLVFGGPPECQTRPQCIAGFERIYGVTFASFKTLDAGGPLTVNALINGDIDVGLVFSSDGAVAAKNLVVLKDDKGMTPVDNIIAIARKEKNSPDLEKVINAVNAKLSTEALSELNKAVGIDKADPAEVAKGYLEQVGLLTGG